MKMPVWPAWVQANHTGNHGWPDADSGISARADSGP